MARQRAWVRAVGFLALLRLANAASSPPNALRVEGTLETQELVRHSTPRHFEFIQQRNTLRLAARWDWRRTLAASAPTSPLLDWIRDGELFLLYRGVYDSVYDYAPSIRYGAVSGTQRLPSDVDQFSDLSHDLRNRYKFENRLREAYLDLHLAGDVLVRAGRQQVVWGASDGFRVLDRANSLDLTWHSFQELPADDHSFDQIRIPAWMLDVRKEGLWPAKTTPHGLLQETLHRSFIEAYWNPGDWTPNKVGFLPTPWGLPIENPTRRLLDVEPGPFRQGRWRRDPSQNSQVGVRGGTDRRLCERPDAGACRFDVHLVYLWKRFTPWGGTTSSAAQLIAHTLPGGPRSIGLNAPYTHTLGLFASGIILPEPITATSRYNEGCWHDSLVVRGETTIDLGVPFYVHTLAEAPVIKDHTVWSGVLGLDYIWTDWMRVALSSQIFWTYMLDRDHGIRGGLDHPVSRPFGVRDDVRRWEILGTLGLTGWLRGGTVRLSTYYLVDPVNSSSQEVTWAARWQVTTGLSAELSQRYFINPGTRANFEPWGLGGQNRGRSETGLELVYTFSLL